MFWQYCAHRGSNPKWVWVTIRHCLDWETIVRKYSEVAVFVAVVEESWFNFDRDEESSVCMSLRTSPTYNNRFANLFTNTTQD